MSNRATSARVDRNSSVAALLDELGGWADGPGPVYRQLARALTRSIERGALAAGARLPSERALALALAISRGTAVAAYDVLVADALVERRQGSGSFVAGLDPIDPFSAIASRSTSATTATSATDGTVASATDGTTLAVPPMSGAVRARALPGGREGTALVHRLVDQSSASPIEVDLSLSVLHDVGGLPGVSVRARDLASVLPDTGYSPWGLAPLRERLARHVARWGLEVSAEQIVVTTGAQQAISMAAACWVRPGDTVLVEKPTYPGAIAAFAQAGAEVIGLPMDRHGVVVDVLARRLEDRPALVYLQSGPHSPTGVVLADRRRTEIAALVEAARVPLVEDLALADLAWERLPAPIATRAGPGASIAVVGSLSKVFWGGLRVGFAIAPPVVALRLARVKATQDLGSSVVSQVLAQRLLDEAPAGFVAERVAELQARHDVLTGELARQLPSWSWATPRGGLSLWVRLPGTDAEAFVRRAAAIGVAAAGPRALGAAEGAPDHIRLSFSPPPEVLREGVRRLAAAWAAGT